MSDTATLPQVALSPRPTPNHRAIPIAIPWNETRHGPTVHMVTYPGATTALCGVDVTGAARPSHGPACEMCDLLEDALLLS